MLEWRWSPNFSWIDQK